MTARPEVDIRKVRDAKPRDLLVRFGLGAGVSMVAGIVSLVAGARLGGVFLAFPAILPASLTFVQHQEGESKADRDAAGAILGSLALLVFAAVAEAMFTRYHPALVLTAALGGWLVAVAVLYVLLSVLRPDEDR